MEKSLLIAVVSLVTFISCSKKKTPADDRPYGLDYYPLQQGKFVVYDVDSTVYRDLPVDTFYYRYRVKEKIADSFTDNLGQPAIRIERFVKWFDPKRPYDSIQWKIKEAWLLSADNKRIQVVENNVRFTKLVFPVEQKASWNGNAGNTSGEWIYSYDYIDAFETVNNTPLESVLYVKQKEFRTLISYQHYAEKYARGVGLVQKEITDILSNNIIAGQPVEKRIETGFIFKQTLVNYGYE